MADGTRLRASGLIYCAVGLGEFFSYPPVAWQDANTLLATHFSTCEINLEKLDNIPISISSLKIGDTPGAVPMIKLLKTVNGNPFSLNFAPGGQVFSYWTIPSGSPNGETPTSKINHALHIALLIGEEDVVYTIGDQANLIGWSPDAQHFIFSTSEDDETYRVFLGSPCQTPVELPAGSWPTVHWLNGEWFILEFIDYNQHHSELLLGSINGTTIPLLETTWETYPQWQATLLP